jgi:AcrR family transcriptional regulator
LATHRTSAGDPVLTLRLLWRRAPDEGRRGPRPRLSLDEIVDAAIRLADNDGLDALGMRQVAQRLGVAPMTLYSYVPGKAELLDLMLDAIYLRMPRPDRTGLLWRERVAAVAADSRALFAAHGWAASVATTRPPLGPGQLAKYEHELRAFDGTGLDDVQTDAALTLVLQFVRSNALAELEVRNAHAASELDDEQWWATAGPLLAELVDPAAYPTATRVGTAAGETHGAAYSPDHAYEFGLQRILDGLDRLITQPME